MLTREELDALVSGPFMRVRDDAVDCVFVGSGRRSPYTASATDPSDRGVAIYTAIVAHYGDQIISP